MTDTKKLKELIVKKGLKMQFVAKTLNLSTYGLSLKIENKSEFKSSEIAILCELLDIKDLLEKEAIFFAKEVDLKSTKI